MKNTKKEITETISSTKKTISPYSCHTFLFPFKWELLFDSIKSFGERCNLDELEKILSLKSEYVNTKQREILKWQRKSFAIDQQLAYNEYNYFYDFVRDVIYDKGDKDNGKNEFNLKSIVRHYEFNLPEVASFFDIKIEKKKEAYQLKIRKIQLDIYETGVGILSYHLQNDTYSQPDDILNINQFGRRIFVGGFQLPYAYNDARKHLDEKEVKFVDIAQELKLSFGKTITIIEDFKECKDFEKFEKVPFFLPKIITELITFNLDSSNKKSLITTEWSYERPEAKIWIAPSIDDRMFVHSWYQCDIEKKLKEDSLKILKDKKEKSLYDFSAFVEKSDFWYKYTFIDHQSGESHRNIPYKNEIIKKGTYDRWLGYGTLYGISKYSFTLFCTTQTPNYLFSVHETMYLKMAELSLIQRATVLRFSDEVQYINSIKDESKKNELIKSLYEYHIRFINKIDFREITPQEQGIELYDMLQKTMRIDTQVEYLDKEMNELHDYALLIEEKKRSRKLDLITYVGVPFSIISLILSFWDLIKDINKKAKIGGIDEDKTFTLNISEKIWLFELVIFIIIIFLLMKVLPQFKAKTIKFWTIIVFVIILLITGVCLPFYNVFKS